MTAKKLSKRDEELKRVRDEVLALTASPLSEYRRQNKYFPVIGEGSHEAKIMFVGEAPGRKEAESGRPFCGSAGRILDELLASIKLPRTEVYITNIVKDRPPDNRDPLPEEIALYAPFLDRQIDIIQPVVIATLGRFAMQYVLTRLGVGESLRPISQLHGQLVEAKTGYGVVKILPLYHPAATIYNQHLRQDLFDDFQKLKNL